MAEDLYHRYEFTFIVQMLTVSQEQAIEESLGGRVEDRRGLQLLTLTSEGMRAATTAITVVDQLVAAGVRPQRTHPDLVSRQDIADRAGVTRQAVGQWVRGVRQALRLSRFRTTRLPGGSGSGAMSWIGCAVRGTARTPVCATRRWMNIFASTAISRSITRLWVDRSNSLLENSY